MHCSIADLPPDFPLRICDRPDRIPFASSPAASLSADLSCVRFIHATVWCIVLVHATTARPPTDSSNSLPPATNTRGITPRSVNSSDVDRAADALLRAGQRPTIEKVRQTIGRGSPNTINPLLDQWWSRLAGRLDAGPAALHRLPEPVLLATEGLWLQCLDEARRRAQSESQSTRKTLARDRQDLELRSHVLSIRESELTARLKQSDERIARLELELETLTTLLRKEQASRLAAERRAAAAPAPAAAPRRNLRKPVRKSPRTGVARKRTVNTKRKPR